MWISFQTIRKELTRLKQLLASEKRSERTMYRRMVGDLAGKGSKKNNRSVRNFIFKRLKLYFVNLNVFFYIINTMSSGSRLFAGLYSISLHNCLVF